MQGRASAALGIILAASTSVILGLAAVSFPVGAYLVFSSGLGDTINYEYPLQNIDAYGGIADAAPAWIGIGDVFIALWCVYAVIFGISLAGPRTGVMGELGNMINGSLPSDANHAAAAIRWFSILVFASALIFAIQSYFEIPAAPLPGDNALVQFLGLTQAPLIEELGFRLVLIGVPAYLVYSRRASAGHFLRSLWHPYAHLGAEPIWKAAALIVIVAVFFGAGHVIIGEPWGAGKMAQATAGGLILGWVYFRYGLAPAILVHWAANYFIFAYAFLVSDLLDIPVAEAFSHSMMQTLEGIFLLAGAAAVVLMALHLRSLIRS